MIRHIFATGLKKGTTEEQLNEIIAALQALKGQIPGMKDIIVTKNYGWYQDKVQLVLCAEFDNKEDWDVYMHFPKHLKVGDDYGHLFDDDTSVVMQIEI